MYKRLFVVAALVITVSSMVGITTVSAVNDKNQKDKEQVTVPVTDDKKEGHESEDNDKKVTICHRTNAANNPYREITVSVNAVDGKGHNDHTSHEGPVATSYAQAKALKKQHIKWGDIIPVNLSDPKDGSYAGKDILLNGCTFPVSAPVAMIDYDIVCEVATKTATITFTNTGNKADTATLNAETFKVKPSAPVVKTIAIATGGTRITITIAGEIAFNEVYKCEGGQGTVNQPQTPPTVPTTPSTPDTVTKPAGQSGQVTVGEEATSIASLPYTAGSKLSLYILIGTSIATLAAIVSTVLKRAHLKQL